MHSQANLFSPETPDCSLAGQQSGGFESRFWAKVTPQIPDMCWEWTSTLDRDGYGQTRIGPTHKNMFAHRIAWQLTNGEIPKGMCVLHRCDNRRCVNPAHLFLGGHAVNMKDMAIKGRCAKKLPNSAVLEIRSNHLKVKARVLAERYGVSTGLIHQIWCGWARPHAGGSL